MRTGRNSGERTGNNAPFLGLEVTQPEQHGAFNTRTSNSSGPHEPAEGAEPSGPAPSFRYSAATPTSHTIWRAAPS